MTITKTATTVFEKRNKMIDLFPQYIRTQSEDWSLYYGTRGARRTLSTTAAGLYSQRGEEVTRGLGKSNKRTQNRKVSDLQSIRLKQTSDKMDKDKSDTFFGPDARN